MQKNQFIPSKKASFFNVNSDLDLMYIYMRQDALTKESYSMDDFYSSNVKINAPDYNNLTFIMPCRYSDENIGDINTLNIILNYLKFIGVNHIIISEEDEYSKIGKFLSKFEDIFDDLQVVFTRSDTLFNKSIAINNAVKKCSTPYVAIMDYGVLVSKKSFDNALSLVDSFYDFVYASNNYFKKIDNPHDLINGFDFDKIDTNEEYDLKYSNILFCNREHLMDVGGYNPLFEKNYLLDMELLIRVVLSEFSLFFVNDISYLLNRPNTLSDKDVNILTSQFNLLKLNEIDILINQNKDMYMNAITFKTEEFKFHSSEYLISIIIPVFNCEFFYIDRCISSLKNQTLGFENIEVILVDDASIYPSSVSIMNSYVDKYDNVKLISLDLNSGAGIARNEGIVSATSDYITFLDHDDYFVKDICEIYYKNMVEDDLDILITNFIDLTEDNPKISDWNLLNLNEGEKIIENYSEDLNIFSIAPVIGSRVYRKDFLIENQLFFTNHKISENLIFNDKTLFEAKKIKLINIPSVIYGYRDTPNVNRKSTNLKQDFSLLINNFQSFKECYNLYLNHDVSLALINNMKELIDYWIKTYFFKIKFSKDEICTIVDEGHDLFSIFNDNTQIIDDPYYNLYNAFISRNYDEVYEFNQRT